MGRHTVVIDTSTLDNLITGAHAVLLGTAVLWLLRAAPFVCSAKGRKGWKGAGSVIVYGGLGKKGNGWVVGG